MMQILHRRSERQRGPAWAQPAGSPLAVGNVRGTALQLACSSHQGLGGASGAFGACGRLVPVPLEDLPGWLPGWCVDHLGGEPAGVLFRLHQVSMVFGLRLAGGREVVVKARADDGRAVSCVAAQARLAARGFPCARPLTAVAGVGSLAVHAEEFRAGGQVLDGDSPEVAARCAEVFAWLMAELAGVRVAPPLAQEEHLERKHRAHPHRHPPPGPELPPFQWLRHLSMRLLLPLHRQPRLSKTPGD